MSIFKPRLVTGKLANHSRVMNIDELLKLPNTEETTFTGGGKEPVELMVVGREKAKTQRSNQRVILVDQAVDKKIATVRAFEESGMKPENVLAMNGMATLEILKFPVYQTNLTNYLFMLPMGFNYNSLSQIVQPQLLFIIVFQQLYYMAVLADIKNIPLFSQSFEKRYTKIKELLSKELVTTSIFGTTAVSFVDEFWKSVKAEFETPFETSFYDVVIWMLEKEPAELDAFFNSFLTTGSNSASLTSKPNSASAARPPPVRPSPPPPQELPTVRPPPPQELPTVRPTPPAQNTRSSRTSDLLNANSTTVSSGNASSVTANIGNENMDTENKPVLGLTANAVFRILSENEDFYEEFIVTKTFPRGDHYKKIYNELMHYKTTQKPSFDEGVRRYLDSKKTRRRGGGKTMKNRKKINYVYE